MLFFAAKLVDYPEFLDSLRFQGVGLTVVMLTLASLWLTLEILGFFFRRVKIGPTASPSSDDFGSPSDEVSPEIVAVIAAAVEASLQQPHHIASIRVVEIVHDHSHGHAWAMEGRRHLHVTRGTR